MPQARPYPTERQGSTLSYLTVSNLIDDFVTGLLPDTAVSILRIILNRTLRLRRQDNSITYEEFCDGVFIDDVCVQRGLGISTATLSKHLKTLTRAGLILVRKGRSQRNGFEFSLYSIDTDALEDFAMAKLPIPRRLKNADGMRENDEMKSISKPRTQQNSLTSKTKVSEGNTNIKDIRELKFSGPAARTVARVRRTRPTAGNTIGETINNLATHREERRAAPQAASTFFGRDGKLIQRAFMAAWSSAVRETFPGAVPAGATVKDFCIFRAQTAEVLKSISIYQLIDYLVGEWDSLRTSKLKFPGQKYAPSVIPDIQSVCRHWKTLQPLLVAHYSEEAVAQHRATANQGKANSAEVKELRQKLSNLSRTVEAERDKMTRLEKEKTELVELVTKEGIDLQALREGRKARQRKQSAALDALHDEVDIDELPEWK